MPHKTEAYWIIKDHLDPTWVNDNIADNLHQECLTHSTDATWVHVEEPSIEAAASKLEHMPYRYTTDTNFAVINHNNTWLAITQLTTSAKLINLIYQHIEDEDHWQDERTKLLHIIEKLRNQIRELER